MLPMILIAFLALTPMLCIATLKNLPQERHARVRMPPRRPMP